MYIRTISRQNKDGSKATYVQLAHNERDPDSGIPKAKVLFNFGRIEHLDVEQLKRLVKSISRFLPPEAALESQVLLQHRGQNLKFKWSRPFGGAYVLGGLWQQLHFRSVLEKRVAQRQFKTPITDAIFAMVANRCLAPSSKRSVCEWLEEDVFINDIAKLNVQVLYRAMDFLLAHQDQIEQEVYWAVADLLNLEVDLILYDTTSTYFETEVETDLKKRGYSKDKRGDLPQAVVGLAVTRHGIPVKHWAFPGNTMDMSTIERVKNDLARWRLNRVVYVHDEGMTSESNLHYLQRGGNHYIVGRKLRSGDSAAEQALSHKGPYTPIQENLLAKEVVIGQGEKRKRVVLVKNTREQKRAQATREKLVQTLQEKIAPLNNRTEKSKPTKARDQLKSHRVYGKYLKELKDGRLKIDRSKLRNEKRYDGKYLLESSDDTLSLADIVLGHKQLYDVEQAFRTLKTTLELRPNYHSRDDRIKCHIFLCFIALVMVRIIEHKTGKTWARIRREMQRIHCGEFQIDSKRVRQLTELNNEHKEIIKKLGLKEPNTIVDIQDN
jgi:transposase